MLRRGDGERSSSACARLGGGRRGVAHQFAQIDGLRIPRRLRRARRRDNRPAYAPSRRCRPQGADIGIVMHHRQRQLHAGERRLEVMADARQHFGALGDMALDALAHGDEGLGGAAHFGGAIGLEVGHRRGPCRNCRRRAPAARSAAPGCAGTGSRCASRISADPTIQRMKMSGWETVTRSRGTRISSTPSFTSTLMSKSLPMRPVPKCAAGADAAAR